MHARSLVVAGVLIAAATGCGYHIKTTSDYDGRVNFSNYGTFFMMKGNSSGDALMDAQLSSDVASELMSKGWAEVPEGEGQAAVIIHTATDRDHTYDTFYSGWGGWHWRWGGFKSPSKFVEDYKVGTVVVTIFDAGTKQAIWRGFAADAISDDPKQARKVREEAVARIFERFPPAAPAVTAGEASPMRSETPDIIFSASPATLILINGDPVYRDVAGTALQRIVNTKALILRDETGSHYLKILDGWMETYSLDSWWSVAGIPPEGAGVALRQAVAAKTVDLLDGDKHSLGSGRAPVVYVSTTPAVLVVTDGAPRFASVAGTSLEFVENTQAKVFREPTDQELYVSVSGRWFRSWTTAGPWQYVPSDQLPADFAKIPSTLLTGGRIEQFIAR
jgi:hypothetical protein